MTLQLGLLLCHFELKPTILEKNRASNFTGRLPKMLFECRRKVFDIAETNPLGDVRNFAPFRLQQMHGMLQAKFADEFCARQSGECNDFAVQMGPTNEHQPSQVFYIKVFIIQFLIDDLFQALQKLLVQVVDFRRWSDRLLV